MILLEKLKSIFSKRNLPINTKQEPAFNKNKVFDDTLFYYRNVNIKKLLANSILNKYPVGSYPVDEWIDFCAKSNNLNPKIILTVLEKNLQLVTRTDFIPVYKLQGAMGVGVLPGGLVAPAYANFSMQVKVAAENYRRWFDTFAVGRKVNCIDDDSVIPENAFTYALYMCDPYVGTNDLYRVTTIKDEDGNVSPEKKLQYEAPFGVYATWKIWRTLPI